MNKLFLIISLLLIIPSALAIPINIENITYSDTGVKDLSFSQQYSCTYDSYQAILFGDNNNTLTNVLSGIGSASMMYFGSAWSPLAIIPGARSYINGVLSKSAYCAQAYVATKLLTEENNITMTYSEYSAKYSGQIGLEDYLFDVERNFVTANTGIIWEYVNLLFMIIIDIMSMAFYIIEFYIVIFILLIAFPKAFLKIRDGISIFLVRRHRKKNFENNGGQR